MGGKDERETFLRFFFLTQSISFSALINKVAFVILHFLGSTRELLFCGERRMANTQQSEEKHVEVEDTPAGDDNNTNTPTTPHRTRLNEIEDSIPGSLLPMDLIRHTAAFMLTWQPCFDATKCGKNVSVANDSEDCGEGDAARLVTQNHTSLSSCLVREGFDSWEGHLEGREHAIVWDSYGGSIHLTVFGAMYSITGYDEGDTLGFEVDRRPDHGTLTLLKNDKIVHVVRDAVLASDETLHAVGAIQGKGSHEIRVRGRQPRGGGSGSSVVGPENEKVSQEEEEEEND